MTGDYAQLNYIIQRGESHYDFLLYLLASRGCYFIEYTTEEGFLRWLVTDELRHGIDLGESLVYPPTAWEGSYGSHHGVWGGEMNYRTGFYRPISENDLGWLDWEALPPEQLYANVPTLGQRWQGEAGVLAYVVDNKKNCEADFYRTHYRPRNSFEVSAEQAYQLVGCRGDGEPVTRYGVLWAKSTCPHWLAGGFSSVERDSRCPEEPFHRFLCHGHVISYIEHTGIDSGDRETQRYRNRAILLHSFRRYCPPLPRMDDEWAEFFQGKIESPGGTPQSAPQLDSQGLQTVSLWQRDEAHWLQHIPHLQPTGGSSRGDGFHFPLRAGSDVVVSCLYNDPEQLVILGHLPLGNQGGALVNCDNPQQNILQTPGGQAIIFDDGQPFIQLHTQGKGNVFQMDASPNHDGIFIHSQQGEITLSSHQEQVFKVHQGWQQTVGLSLVWESIAGELQLQAKELMQLVNEQGSLSFTAKDIRLRSEQLTQMESPSHEVQAQSGEIIIDHGPLHLKVQGDASFQSGEDLVISAEDELDIICDAGDGQPTHIHMDRERIAINAQSIVINASGSIELAAKADYGAYDASSAEALFTPTQTRQPVISPLTPHPPLKTAQSLLIQLTGSAGEALPYTQLYYVISAGQPNKDTPIPEGALDLYTQTNGKAQAFVERTIAPLNVQNQSHEQRVTLDTATWEQLQAGNQLTILISGGLLALVDPRNGQLCTELTLDLTPEQCRGDECIELIGLMPPVVVNNRGAGQTQPNQTQWQSNLGASQTDVFYPLFQRQQLFDAELNYFQQRGGHVTVFIHGYNVPQGGFGKQQLATAQPSSSTQDNDAFARYWYQTTTDKPADYQGEAGGLRWVACMEHHMNHAAGFEGDYRTTDYQRLVHFLWQGDPENPADYLAAETLADKASEGLVILLNQLHQAGLTISVIAHSLGNRVLLSALNQLAEQEKKAIVTHSFLWQPAIPDTCLSPQATDMSIQGNWELGQAYQASEHISVLHSSRDHILGPLNTQDKAQAVTIYHAKEAKLEYYLSYACEQLSTQVLRRQPGELGYSGSVYELAHILGCPLSEIQTQAGYEQWYNQWIARHPQRRDGQAWPSYLSETLCFGLLQYRCGGSTIPTSVWTSGIASAELVWLEVVSQVQKTITKTLDYSDVLAAAYNKIPWRFNQVRLDKIPEDIRRQLGELAPCYVALLVEWFALKQAFADDAGWILPGRKLAAKAITSVPGAILSLLVELDRRGQTHRLGDKVGPLATGIRFLVQALYVISETDFKQGTLPPPRPAMGYGGIEWENDLFIRELIDDGKLHIVDQTPWLWEHSGMLLASEELIDEVIKKHIANGRGMQFGLYSFSDKYI